MLGRVFGRAKPKEAPPPPPDMAAHQKSMNDRVDSTSAKINDLDAQLLKLKQQIAASKLPSQCVERGARV